MELEYSDLEEGDIEAMNAAAFETSAVWANAISVTVLDHTVRLTFAEHNLKGNILPQPRVAVMLPRDRVRPMLEGILDAVAD